MCRGDCFSIISISDRYIRAVLLTEIGSLAVYHSPADDTSPFFLDRACAICKQHGDKLCVRTNAVDIFWFCVECCRCQVATSIYVPKNCKYTMKLSGYSNVLKLRRFTATQQAENRVDVFSSTRARSISCPNKDAEFLLWSAVCLVFCAF